MNEIYGRTAESTRVAGASSQVAPEERETIGPLAREVAWLISTARERGMTLVLSKMENLAEVAEETAAALRHSARRMAEKESLAISRYCDLTADGLRTAASGLRNLDPDIMMADGRRFVRSHPFIFMSGAMATGFIASRKGSSEFDQETAAALNRNRQSKRMRTRLATLASQNLFASGIFALSAGALLGAALPWMFRKEWSADIEIRSGAPLAWEREAELAAKLESRSQAAGFGPEEMESEVEAFR